MARKSEVTREDVVALARETVETLEEEKRERARREEIGPVLRRAEREVAAREAELGRAHETFGKYQNVHDAAAVAHGALAKCSDLDFVAVVTAEAGGLVGVRRESSTSGREILSLLARLRDESELHAARAAENIRRVEAALAGARADLERVAAKFATPPAA